MKITMAARRSAVIAGLCAALAACATVPYFDESLSDPQLAAASPEIAGADGPLSAERSKAILAKVAAEPADTGMLRRHLAIEEALADRPLVAGNRITVLRDGPATFRAMFAAIKNARRHINLEYFIFEDVEYDGVRLGDLLLDKRRQGVAVNVMYDSIGSAATPAEFFARLRQGGVNVVEFRPIQPINALDALLLKDVLPASPSPRNRSFNNRDHRKILVVDGGVAIIGGINISARYQSSPSGGSRSNGAPMEYWRDNDLLIEGPAVRDVQTVFLEQWRKQEGPALDERSMGLFPPLRARGDEVIRIIASTPDHHVPQYYATVLSAIRNAEKRIWLSAAYFVPTRQEMDFLTDAAKRGVDVRLLLADKSDSALSIAAAHSHYGRLLEAGVRIFETHGVVLHAKTVVIDGVWTAIGSSNFDHRSVLFNDEIDGVVVGSNTAAEMERMFEDDFASATEITRETWSRRPLVGLVDEFLTVAWERWL